MREPRFLWIKVTSDEYELPLAVADTANELANQLGITSRTIYAQMSTAEKTGINTCYKRVPYLTDEEEEAIFSGKEYGKK